MGGGGWRIGNWARLIPLCSSGRPAFRSAVLLLSPLHQAGHLLTVAHVGPLIYVGEMRVDGAGGKPQLLADGLDGVAKRSGPGVPRTSLGFFLIRESVRVA